MQNASFDEGVLAGEKIELGERTSATYEVLREWIVSGQLAPGVEISQLELTRRLGVSRTPLREALRLLTRDGLVVETEAHRRVLVSPVSMGDLEEIYTLRVPVAALAIWQTVPLLTVSDLAGLHADLELISSPDLFVARDAHRRYHATLAKYAGRRIREALWGFMLHSERYQRAFANKSRTGRKQKQNEHAALIAACEQGRRDVARQMLVDHMSSTALGLMKKHGYEPRMLYAAIDMALHAPSEDYASPVERQSPWTVAI